MNTPVLFLVGPTAAGKSELAMEIASRLNAEILSADSMQVYRGMNIGTAKPAAGDQRKVRHHLIDERDPCEEFSVFEYRVRALQCLHDLVRRNKNAIVSGGTGLYVRALLEGLSPRPGASPAVRERLKMEALTGGLSSLYARLGQADPETAKKIKPQDEKRIIRALEIFELTGRKPSDECHHREPLTAYGFEPVVIGVTPERSRLYERIERRVDEMFEAGWVAEVEDLARRPLSKTASQAVGYKEILERLSGGRAWNSSVEDEVKAVIKKNTRHLAKRQLTWFKRERGIRWVVWEEREDAGAVCNRILKIAAPQFPAAGAASKKAGQNGTR